jgi:arylsulfatase A-like enzyme
LYRNAEEINDAAFSLLQEAKDGQQPFFLFLNYMDPHWPYYPPPPFDTRWPGKRPDLLTTASRTRVAEEVLRLDRPISESERDHFVSQYDGAIAYLDAHLGMLLDRLRELDLYDNSLLIVTSDHGEAFGERSMVDHGVSVYQDQVYVPLIVKYPNVNDGKIEDSVVSLVDIFPTVLDVVLEEVPENVAGHSLLQLEVDRATPVVAESFPNSSLLEDHPRFHRTSRAIFDWPYKFIGTTPPKRELYSLAVAFSEGEDLIERDTSLGLELEEQLDSWLAETLARSVDDPLLNLDEATIERLRSLGYIK